jgi:hypothetical protein
VLQKLRQEAAAAEGNNPDGEYDEEDEVQRAIRLSRGEEEYQQGVLGRGGQYECGGVVVLVRGILFRGCLK